MQFYREQIGQGVITGGCLSFYSKSGDLVISGIAQSCLVSNVNNYNVSNKIVKKTVKWYL